VDIHRGVLTSLFVGTRPSVRFYREVLLVNFLFFPYLGQGKFIRARDDLAAFVIGTSSLLPSALPKRYLSEFARETGYQLGCQWRKKGVEGPVRSVQRSLVIPTNTASTDFGLTFDLWTHSSNTCYLWEHSDLFLRKLVGCCVVSFSLSFI